jgi:hypothetical protein
MLATANIEGAGLPVCGTASIPVKTTSHPSPSCSKQDKAYRIRAKGLILPDDDQV